MLKLVVVFFLIVLITLISSLIWFKRSRSKPGSDPNKTSIAFPVVEEENWGICKKCGERRIIINQSAGLCGQCWSAKWTNPP